MKMALKIVGFFGCKSLLVASIQLHTETADTKEVLKAFPLDEKEVEKRGSHCLDGSAPTYYHKVGKAADKWAIQIQAGSGICMDEEDCYKRLPVTPRTGWGVEPVLRKYDESGYNLLLLYSCDYGMFLGDLSKPVQYKGTKLYFQGARIMKHFIDTISKNYTMKEVLLIGGSGAGHTIFVGAEYFRSLMPASVTKFGIAPINGWYTLHHAMDFKYMFNLMGAKGQVNSKCVKQQDRAKIYNCLEPINVYDNLNVDVFVTQIFDHTFKSHEGEHNIGKLSKEWDACMGEKSKGKACEPDAIETLQSYMHNFTAQMKGFSKYNNKGSGGFLSTCSFHRFYASEDYFKFKNDGHTVEDAIWTWWNGLDRSPHSKWYLPCELKSQGSPQCESSCKS